MTNVSTNAIVSIRDGAWSVCSTRRKDALVYDFFLLLRSSQVVSSTKWPNLVIVEQL